jgi:UDP-N-acetylmuramate: L-alanyl-gamma-D-glutamyl-meso-diaminopimelate ligase
MAAKRLHFIGIAGHTMRGLALAARELGYEVSGTDSTAYPPGSDWLDAQGLKWWREPAPEHITGVDRVIISGGVAKDDVELVAAQQQGITIQSYAEFVGELVAAKRRIVVSGTHGKTTTTSLIAWLLDSGGRQPDFLVGIQPRNFDSSVRLTDAKLGVLEGDEYRASTLDSRSKFWYYHPDMLVATSLEMDHPDMFTDVVAIQARFRELAEAMKPDGRVLYWSSSPALEAVFKDTPPQVATYGESGDWHANHVQLRPEGISFDLYEHDNHRGHFTVGLYGQHNVDNATAAIAVALGEGLTAEQIQEGCQNFKGASRRFEMVSAPESKIIVVDDYAHHPTEIAATLRAVKAHFGGRVIAVVRPHTYTRTATLLPQFREAVRLADYAFITDIEGAREAGAAMAVSSRDIVLDNGAHVSYAPDRKQLINDIAELAKPGDTVVCMTVGGYDGLAGELAKRLG